MHCLVSGMLALPVSAKHISANDFKVEKNDILTIDKSEADRDGCKRRRKLYSDSAWGLV